MKWTRIVTSERTRYDVQGDLEKEFEFVLLYNRFFKIDLKDRTVLLNPAHIVSVTIEGEDDDEH